MTRIGHRLTDWPALRARAAQTDGVIAAIPSLAARAMLTVAWRSAAVDLQGLAPADMPRVPAFASPALIAGTVAAIDGIAAIGSDLALREGMFTGSPVAVTLVRLTADGQIDVHDVGMRVASIVETGNYAFDGRRIVIPIHALQQMLGSGDVASRIDVFVARPDDTAAVAPTLRRRLGPAAIVTSLRDANASLFAALAAERMAMTTIISLVVATALSNILSSMVLLVRCTAREIAVLRTMGMARAAIVRIFLGVGTSIGLLGGVGGLALGPALKSAKEPIVRAVQSTLSIRSPELAVLLDLPLVIAPVEVAWMLAAVLVRAVASTVRPAMKAATIDPVAVLRYD